MQEIEINIESIEVQQNNNELIVKILTFLSTHENLLIRKNSNFLLNKVSKEVIETKDIFDIEMISTENKPIIETKTQINSTSEEIQINDKEIEPNFDKTIIHSMATESDDKNAIKKRQLLVLEKDSLKCVQLIGDLMVPKEKYFFSIQSIKKDSNFFSIKTNQKLKKRTLFSKGSQLFKTMTTLNLK